MIMSMLRVMALFMPLFRLMFMFMFMLYVYGSDVRRSNVWPSVCQCAFLSAKSVSMLLFDPSVCSCLSVCNCFSQCVCACVCVLHLSLCVKMFVYQFWFCLSVCGSSL